MCWLGVLLYFGAAGRISMSVCVGSDHMICLTPRSDANDDGYAYQRFSTMPNVFGLSDVWGL